MNRIGQEGIERIFKISVDLEGKDSKQDKLCIDTTVQEKNHEQWRNACYFSDFAIIHGIERRL